MSNKLIPLYEGELGELICRAVNGNHVNVAFGTGGCALQYDDEKELPWMVYELASIRGLLVENINGMGI
jgi:hypothetical protein